ncbi:MAG: sulfotransferase domain-containing protein [Leptolyngbyaceae cyanobacterium]
MKTPNFIVVGAHKAGTSSLHHYLEQHPQIYLPPEKGLDLLWQRKFRELEEAGEYLAQFDGAEPGQVLGEVSSVYLQRGPELVEKIKHLFPDVKIIAVLRNPIDRAYSHALWGRKYTQKEIENLEHTIVNSQKFKKNYLFAGEYCTHLKTYFSCFEREQVKVLLYDDFSKNPQKFFSEFFNFVGVDPDFLPDTSQKLHSGSIKLTNSSTYLLAKGHSLGPVIGKFIPQGVRTFIREKLSAKTRMSKPSMSMGLRLQLIDYFRDEVTNLQELTGLQVAHWLDVPD